MKPAGLLDAPLAIVDLETTGAHPAWDRVTEIAVVEVHEGEVVSEWSTLVNPGTSIPPAIQVLTGITNDMVADAPAFEDLAQDLYERLDGRVFVAHNARFDYGFLRHEFERAGLRFQARTLCTVKLSRRLYPGHARHNLDSLIERHRLACESRHRAMGDAQAVWQFLRVAAEERGLEQLQDAARQLAQLPALPAHIPREVVDAIPDAPGVYLFYGENDTPLYVGKSVAMRSRVLQHFSGDVHSAREAQIAREIRRIEWWRSCGELGALLREAALVKELLPVFNRQLRRATDLCAFAFHGKDLQLVSAEQINSETVPFLCGVFRSRRAAMDALRGLADEHRLCLRALGFEKSGKGACFRHQIRRCAGVCAGREDLQTHHARAAAALAGLKTAAWPWRGPIAIVEEDRERDAVDLHVVHNWCLLGVARSEAEVAELMEGAPRPSFDLDHYKILARHLSRGRPRIVELGGAAALMHVELVVPALLHAQAGAPALELLLARGRRTAIDRGTPEDWACGAFGAGEGPLPAGALTALAGGLEPGTGYWMRADPVHLRADRDRLLLLPSAGFPLAAGEAEPLVAALNAHFAAEFSLHAARPDAWCLSTGRELPVSARAPLEVAGRSIDAELPDKRWHALLNEIQMAMYQHPVNTAREARGEPVVNGVWLWGAGRLPADAALNAPAWQSVSADDPSLLGLARLVGLRHRAPGPDAAQWLERAPEDGRHLVLLDELRAPHALGDATALERRLLGLEERWFAPLLAALRGGRIGMVSLRVPDAGAAFETTRADLRRFWRRPRTLAAYRDSAA